MPVIPVHGGARPLKPPSIPTVLTREEWRLVSMLRELPASPLRERLMALLDELVDFAREPRCPEAQADGVPCDTAEMACDQCRQVMTLLEMLRMGLRGH